ncbi:uncharacterized protein BX664DRAFT_382166 [Halteromyces radiatus]|uniref:uncharacterized protein n=1 Tax=Halteromyces radiatus TaxID=101107 RepID=UPI002220FE7E|nr:uncharacterized protein BX664DRAFT_382166 [Halteromyces radiatus]KAI8099659.1 hypothetical protein BX664DRAFT_382166 [Halteromyces radiatus]
MNSPTIKEEKVKQARFSFQYFDEACDVGVENEHGERVRKRKRPGRKPNPPSQQERREQNRLAQRNFREREQQRRQARDRQWKEYMEELDSLRQRVAVAEYESNYLRGLILQLLLASIAQRGTVPQVWIDTRRYPIPHPTMVPTPPSIDENETSKVPAILQLVLDDQTHSIVHIKKALEIADGHPSSCPLVRRAHHARLRQQQQLRQQQPTNIDIPSIPMPPPTTPCQFKSIQELLSSEIVSLNTDSQDIRRTFPTSPPLSVFSPTSLTDSEIDRCNPSDQKTSHQQPQSISPITTKTTTLSAVKRVQSVKGIISESPTLKRPEDLSHMPPLQALHILRLQLKIASVIGEKIPFTLTPTALQRVVPHDIRIDYVPSGAIRDRMIIFQDYFDMDECFQLLCSHSVFVGGDVRDSRNWVLDPIITEKYWFFSHHLFDHHFDDCHMPEEMADLLKEWSSQPENQQQQQHHQSQQDHITISKEHHSSYSSSQPNKENQHTDTDNSTDCSSSSAFQSLPTPC